MRVRILHGILFSVVGFIALAFGYGIDKITLKSLIFLIIPIVGGFLMVAPMSWAIYMLILYLGIEGFAKLMSNYNPIIHIGSDLLILALWLRVTLSFLLQRRHLPSTYPPLTSLFIIHAIWFFITILNPYSLSLFASLAGIKLYITIFSLYFFGYYLSDSIPKVRAFMGVWVLIGVLQISTALYQAAIGPSSVTSLSPAYSLALAKFRGYAFRPFGLTSQPGMPSVFIYLIAPFLFYFLFHSKYFLISLVMLLLIPASILTLLLCQVRSALLKALLGGGIFSLFTFREFSTYPKRTRVIIAPFIAILITVALTATPYLINTMVKKNSDSQRAIERSMTLFDYSKVSKARGGAMSRFMTYLEIAPLGAGLSRMGAASAKFQDLIKGNKLFSRGFFADNLWIELLVDLGLPGTFIITLLIGLIIWQGLKGLFRTKDPQIRAIQGTLLCALFSIIIGFFGAEPILYNPEGGFFWFFSGVLLRLPTLDSSLNKEG